MKKPNKFTSLNVKRVYFFVLYILNFIFVKNSKCFVWRYQGLPLWRKLHQFGATTINKYIKHPCIKCIQCVLSKKKEARRMKMNSIAGTLK